MDELDTRPFAFSITETARRTSLSVATVRRRIDDGTLRSVMVGKRRLVPAEAIKTMLQGAAA